MGKKLDLAGIRFGRLVVIRPTDKRAADRSVVWECLCDCGTYLDVSGNNLNTGHTKSCGCLRVKNLVGKRFGKLVVESFVACRVRVGATWMCKCDCGVVVVRSSAVLRAAGEKSCGCHRKNDLRGIKFCRLTVVSELSERAADGSVVWECLCDCGEKVVVSSSDLRRKRVKSCGCLVKENHGLPLELKGKRFGRLVVTERVGMLRGGVLWSCACDCGKKHSAVAKDLAYGAVLSCGCLNREINKKRGLSDKGTELVARMTLANYTSLTVADLPHDLIKLQAARIQMNRAIRRVKNGKS